MKTPDRNDLKLGTVVVLNTAAIDFGFKGVTGTGSASLHIFGLLQRNNDEEPLPLPIAIHADDVVW